ENPFPGLFLQAMKLSEDGRKIVFRLLEADGKSGVIKTDGAYEVMNMPEDVLARPMEVEYHPFEIVTLAKEIRQ
ncbi:MAG: glycosyl hydrolase-related protein, partial [Bullifex sp.]